MRIKLSSGRHAVGMLAALCTFFFVVVGCGGGGGGGGGGGSNSQNGSVAVDINWPERSRAANAPSSALSVVLIVDDLGTAGDDFTSVFNRSANLNPHAQIVSVPNVPAGAYTLVVRFHAQANGAGAVVASAQLNVQVSSGQTTNAGSVALTSNIATVEVNAGQSVAVDESKDLAFTARNDAFAVVAVTPGSATWALTSGGANMSLTEDGTATGLQVGAATVTVSLDLGDSNVTSVAQTINVTSVPADEPTWVPANRIFYTTIPDSNPDVFQVRHVAPNGGNPLVFMTLPVNVVAAAPNPAVDNQLIFAWTDDIDLDTGFPEPSARYAFYKNASLSKTGAQKITSEIVNPFLGVGAIQVTPDGSKIIFTALVGETSSVYSMNSNGSAVDALDEADDANLSVDGTKIVYSKFEVDNGNIWSMSVTGANKERIVDFESDDLLPQWSKDGTKIVFASMQASDQESENFDIYRMNANGSQLTRITATPDDEVAPSFSTDATQIAFLKFAIFGDPIETGIYVVNNDIEQTPVQIVADEFATIPVYWTSDTGRSRGSAATGGGRNLRVSFPRK